MNPTTSNNSIKRALRPDVHQLVNALVNEHPRNARRECVRWQHYYYAKNMISHRCGWDARDGGYDQAQFDMAMAEFVRRAGL